MKCGKPQCACASDATKRHGPYFELTYKANGKTVNVKLSPEAAPLYTAAAKQYRKLKTLWVFRSMRIDIPLDLNKDSGRMGIGIPLA
jgi:hypothetical protein